MVNKPFRTARDVGPRSALYPLVNLKVFHGGLDMGDICRAGRAEGQALGIQGLAHATSLWQAGRAGQGSCWFC